MNHAAGEERDNATLWLVCLVAVVAAHVGGGLILVSLATRPPAEIVAPVLTIDLAPLPTAPPADTPPAMPAAEAPPPEPVAEPPAPPLDIPPPEPPPELVLEPPRVPVIPDVQLPPRPAPPKKPPPVHPVAPPRPVPSDPTPATAPAANAPLSPTESAAAAANWQSRLLAHLTRFKRYPPAAQLRREQGVALLRFRMTPSGEVLSFQLARTSGHAALDQETLELIRRAQPLPAMPPDMPQQPIELVVPLRYELR